jgi:hypothetical protein
MLQNREPFESAFKLLNFLGCWGEVSNVRRRWMLKIPSACGVILAFWIILSLLHAEEYNEAITVFEILPVIFLILFSMSDISTKKEKIKKLFAIVDSLELENSEMSEHIESACRLNTIISVVALISLIITAGVYAITPIFIGRVVFPVYIPEIWKNNAIAYYFSWIFQALTGCYLAVFFSLLYEFRNTLMLTLVYVMEFFRLKLSGLRSLVEDERAKLELQKCINIHLQIQE